MAGKPVVRKKDRVESRWRRALKIGTLAGVVGFGAGTVIALVAGGLGGVFYVWLPFYFGAVTGVAGYLIGAFVIEQAGELASRLYLGSKVGSRREFSHAQAMAARGDYAAAVEVFEAAAEEFPDDPSPLLQGARVIRDGLKDYRTAEEWLRRAHRIPKMEATEQITIAQELVDLYDGPLGEPRKALPLLARVAEDYPGTTAGEWAARRLARLRTEAWTDVKETDPSPAPRRKPPPNPDPTI